MRKLKKRATFKSVFGIVLILAIFAAIVSIIGYRTFTDALLNQYADGAFLTADTAAQLLDMDRMEAYKKSGGLTEEYTKIWNEMDSLCNSTGSTFIYVITPDRTDYGHITFWFSTIKHDTEYSRYTFGYLRETTNNDYRKKYRNLYEKKSERELVIRDKGYIETDPHITAMIGLKDSDGEVQAILCVQRQMDVLSSVRRSYLRKIAASLILLLLLVITSQTLFIHKTVLLPLQMISEETTRFSVENVPAEKKLRERIRNRDEIGMLAESIDKMEEQIQNYVDHLTQITAERERVKTEMTLATRIQEDMLPNVFPAFPDRNEFDIYASMDPAREVGGDFYDFFMVDDDHLCMVMADVSGKGVPAALFMMASKIILANNTMIGKTPARILTDTNASICSHKTEEMFVTVWLGILELSTGRLTAANAGHEFPAVKHPDGGFELFKDKHGLVIGAMEGIKYTEYELTLEPGAKLFLYTDGVPEATDKNDELFGTGRMIEALNEAPDGKPEEILKTVRRAVDGFAKDAEQFDDLTMMCLEYRGPGNKRPDENNENA